MIDKPLTIHDIAKPRWVQPGVLDVFMPAPRPKKDRDALLAEFNRRDKEA